MTKKIIIVAVLMFILSYLCACQEYPVASQKNEIKSNLAESEDEKVEPMGGMVDPSIVYCKELGYKSRVEESETGSQHMVCIFPDGNECETWDFYRGVCGKEWSYCTKQGYEMKDMGSNEGWLKGVVCITRDSSNVNAPQRVLTQESTTDNEGLSVFDLMNLDKKVNYNSE